MTKTSWTDQKFNFGPFHIKQTWKSIPPSNQDALFSSILLLQVFFVIYHIRFTAFQDGKIALTLITPMNCPKGTYMCVCVSCVRTLDLVIIMLFTGDFIKSCLFYWQKKITGQQRTRLWSFYLYHQRRLYLLKRSEISVCVWRNIMIHKKYDQTHL